MARYFELVITKRYEVTDSDLVADYQTVDEDEALNIDIGNMYRSPELFLDDDFKVSGRVIH